MCLIYAEYPHPEPIENAVRLVMSRQQKVRTLTRINTWPLRLRSTLSYAYELTRSLGRILATGSYRRHLQQDLCHCIS